jgi:hypothetical protein
MDFDLSSVPAGSTVLAAFLSLTAIGPFATTGEVATIGHVGDNACQLQRIIDPWNENVVTWNTQPTVTDENQVLLTTSTYPTQNYLNIDVSALVQDMIDDPAGSHGFRIALVNETLTRGMAFHSSEAPDPDRRPLLTVVYGNCAGPIGMDVLSNGGVPFMVTPNVTSAGGTVVLNGSVLNAKVQRVEIRDADGRLVLSRAVGTWPFTLDIPEVAAGIYPLVVLDSHGSNIGVVRVIVH